MAKPFSELRECLLKSGVAPRHVRRYIFELSEHLADLRAEEIAGGRNRNDAEAAALLRLGATDELAKAMIDQRQFQAWSARAPWAIFGLAPILLLSGAWFVALFILWSGWQMFLPHAETPFGGAPHYGIVNIYFQLGKMIYFIAPFLVGWAIGLIAIRQRLKSAWPAIGLTLLAYFAGTAQVHADRNQVLNGFGHINLGFGFDGQSISQGLMRILVVLVIMLLPYAAWRLRQSFLVRG
ncbi:MAG: hypothetical protein WBQ95_00765 [Terracidiphilus sp.]